MHGRLLLKGVEHEVRAWHSGPEVEALLSEERRPQGHHPGALNDYMFCQAAREWARHGAWHREVGAILPERWHPQSTGKCVGCQRSQARSRACKQDCFARSGAMLLPQPVHSQAATASEQPGCCHSQ